MHWGSWTTHHVARKEWNVVLNPLRQVQYCHVKSGMACFQMPENPGVLNRLILKGESVASRANDDTGACEHEDSRPGRKRKDRHQSEQHKSKFTRCDHHRSGFAIHGKSCDGPITVALDPTPFERNLTNGAYRRLHQQWNHHHGASSN